MTKYNLPLPKIGPETTWGAEERAAAHTVQFLDNCPSGECQDYTYSDDFRNPRPVQVVIHTREDYRQCQVLADLMADPGPAPGDLAWADATSLAIAGDML